MIKTDVTHTLGAFCDTVWHRYAVRDTGSLWTFTKICSFFLDQKQLVRDTLARRNRVLHPNR
jgi:hypothetical protein